MITKHIEKGSYDIDRLIKYLLSHVKRDVGGVFDGYISGDDIKITNCKSHNDDFLLHDIKNPVSVADVECAALEILSTQNINQRAIGNKNYHLVFSFHDDEFVDNKTIKEIEYLLCSELGYESHQRISFVHRNTNNLHCHIVINKINPVTYRMLNCWFSYIKQLNLSDRLEAKYGLRNKYNNFLNFSDDS
jgi:Relaxase/Mobilisation nuclease domain